MASCTAATPAGEYGGDVYGDGVVSCDSSVQIGYGGGLPQCTPGWLGDPNLVATIVQVSDTFFIGHGSKRFGIATYNAKSYPKCKEFYETAMGRKLIEVRESTPGTLSVVYLKIPSV